MPILGMCARRETGMRPPPEANGRLFRRDMGMMFLAMARPATPTAHHAPDRHGQYRHRRGYRERLPRAATASGYANTGAFIAAVRDAFGVTPAVYRDQTVSP
jgi:AraC-like DNA-binding protein